PDYHKTIKLTTLKISKTLFIVLLTITSTNLCAQTYPEMIVVQGGSFMMGNTETESAADNHPSHEVMLHTFSISKTPITVTQYREYCRTTGTAMPAPPSLGWIDSSPITNVSWQDAVGYADWLSNK